MNPTPYEESHDEQMAAELSNTIDGLVPSDQETEETLTPMSDVPLKKKMGLMTVLLMGVGLCVLGAGGWVAYGQYQQKMKSRHVSAMPAVVPEVHSNIVNKDLLVDAPATPASAAGDVKPQGVLPSVNADVGLPGVDATPAVNTPPADAASPAASTLDEKAAAATPAVTPIKADIAPLANEKKAPVEKPAVEVKAPVVAAEKPVEKTKEVVNEKTDTATVVEEKPVKQAEVKSRHAVKKAKKHMARAHRGTSNRHAGADRRTPAEANVIQSQQRAPDAITAPAAKKPDAQFWQPMF